jgi:hypothetical protein
LPVPAAIQGKSLRPLTEGSLAPLRNEFYYDHLYETDGSAVYLPKSEGVVQPRYKYMRYFNGKNQENFFFEELYDQVLDPFEVHNLSNNPQASALKEKLVQSMKRIRVGLK